MSRVIRILLLCSLLHAAPVGAASKSTARAARPVSDADLEQEIRARFARSKIAANQFRVRVQGGVATIEGTTAVIQHKGAATRMARSAGARAVRNKIQISEAARERAAKNLEAGRRAKAAASTGPPRSTGPPGNATPAAGAEPSAPEAEPVQEAARPRKAVVKR